MQKAPQSPEGSRLLTQPSTGDTLAGQPLPLGVIDRRVQLLGDVMWLPRLRLHGLLIAVHQDHA